MQSMAKSYLCSLQELFDLNIGDNEKPLCISSILIPLVQRDYAQGREHPDIVRVRERFLASLKDAILGQPICLDFVYGSVNDKGELILLDGQQRITTLFLLHWYAAKRCQIIEADYHFLSRFSYETRPSSREFCKLLLMFSPVFDLGSIKDQIIDQAWFPLDWQNDPTIKSMLTMIDDIHSSFKDVEHLWNALTIDKKIQFFFLPMEKLGLTDELYIKMNSRGKPLTTYEHFKAELEHELKQVDEVLARELEHKLDIEWTDFLWSYRKDDHLTDDLFLNYLKFICDIICYESGKSPLNRSYDEFKLIEIYFSHHNPKCVDNIKFLIQAMDCFCNLHIDIKKELFEKHLSGGSYPDKARVSGPIDLLEHCFYNYVDPILGKRKSSFTLGQIVLLYAFLQYAQHYDGVTPEQFNERIRIINNLVMNSADELVEGAAHTGGIRIPAILRQTKSIIVDGKILGSSEISINFNANQLAEEVEKQQWRRANPYTIPTLNMLENHDLLYGQISIVGLENVDLFDRFTEVFNCDRDLVTCALLVFGDYSRVEKGWRYTFGSKDYDAPWKFLFHKNASAEGFDRTSDVLVSLLKSHEHFDDAYLESLIADYIGGCESEHLFDWRYYIMKYDEFRPNRYGKYWIKKGNYYDIYVMYTPSKLSENAYQPFLKVIDPVHIDRDDCGQRLKYDDRYVYCEGDRFVIKDLSGVVVDSIIINQNEFGFDAENRIDRFLAEQPNV